MTELQTHQWRRREETKVEDDGAEVGLCSLGFHPWRKGAAMVDRTASETGKAEELHTQEWRRREERKVEDMGSSGGICLMIQCPNSYLTAARGTRARQGAGTWWFTSRIAKQRTPHDYHDDGLLLRRDAPPQYLGGRRHPGRPLISEVLVRLPIKSIARCRCVCRSWRAAISSAAFVRRHRDLSRARPPAPPSSSSSMLSILFEIAGYRTYISASTTSLYYHRRGPPPPSSSSHVNLSHCDGLVTITTTSTDRVFVCNPATQEFIKLPRGTHSAEVDYYARRRRILPLVAIGFDRWRNSYVVARYFYRKYGGATTFDDEDDDTGESASSSPEDYDIGHEVFTLGSGDDGGSWEVTDDPPGAIGVQAPICTRRGFYWHSGMPNPRLLRFGLKDRSSEVVARPPTAGEWSPLDGMAVMDDGKLCYLHTATEASSLHVWTANDDDDDGNGVLKWSLLCRIDFPDDELDSDLYELFLPTVITDGDTLVAVVEEMVYRYTMRDGRMEEVFDIRRQLQYGRPEYKLRPPAGQTSYCRSSTASPMEFFGGRMRAMAAVCFPSCKLPTPDRGRCECDCVTACSPGEADVSRVASCRLVVFKHRPTLATTIPDDLLISEILVHLPAKSLARCRCVCRSWRAGIAGAAFVRRQRDLSRARPPSSVLIVVRRQRDLSRARPPSSVLIVPREYDRLEYRPRATTTTEISFHHRLVLPSPPGGQHMATEAEAADLMLDKAWPDGITNVIFLTHCDGLVAISTATDRVLVCNPATRELVALPLGTHNAELDGDGEPNAVPVAIGFDTWRNSYVVARYYFYRMYGEMVVGGDAPGEWSQDYDIGHEVFTLGSGDGHRPPARRHRSPEAHLQATWPRVMMRFDLKDRVFEVVAYPPTSAWRPFDEMADLDDVKLCYIHAVADASFHVWMAEEEDDGPDLHWSLRCCIDLPDAVPKRPFSSSPMTGTRWWPAPVTRSISAT
ncbi:hypothetical protein HU200_003442 [Digitaria exilis]|uniref:F-box domain-containing protein n=1 Tax=Digitaria exilis TaxID=1010633 RepID=A0A835KYJ2_9POAL|nr:hypothetical protein HU200_003442 [Digitaria exilis]